MLGREHSSPGRAVELVGRCLPLRTGGIDMHDGQGQGPEGTFKTCLGARHRPRPGLHAVRRNDGAVVSQVGTILLVVLTVVMATAVGAAVWIQRASDARPLVVAVAST